MNNETILKVPLSKEEIKIVRTALAYFGLRSDHVYSSEILDILDTLTSVESIDAETLNSNNLA